MAPRIDVHVVHADRAGRRGEPQPDERGAAAAAELVRCSGTQLDPAVVQAILAVAGVEPAEPRDGDLLPA